MNMASKLDIDKALEKTGLFYCLKKKGKRTKTKWKNIQIFKQGLKKNKKKQQQTKQTNKTTHMLSKTIKHTHFLIELINGDLYITGIHNLHLGYVV